MAGTGWGQEGRNFTFTLELCLLYIAQVSMQINVNRLEQSLGSCWRRRRRAHPRTGLRTVAGEWPGARPLHPRDRRPKLAGLGPQGWGRPRAALWRPPQTVRRRACGGKRPPAAAQVPAGVHMRAGARVCPGRARVCALVPALACPCASLPAALVRPPLREHPGTSSVTSNLPPRSPLRPERALH